MSTKELDDLETTLSQAIFELQTQLDKMMTMEVSYPLYSTEYTRWVELCAKWHFPWVCQAQYGIDLMKNTVQQIVNIRKELEWKNSL